jgi:Co/Zn/Cd efflux system component
MCSAYTHVFADTLRSIAVIVAAGVDKVVNGVTPEEADAAAAVVVSILIVLSLIPLCSGLASSVSELRAIQREEEAETTFQQRRDEQIS